VTCIGVTTATVTTATLFVEFLMNNKSDLYYKGVINQKVTPFNVNGQTYN
jgi:hypothetical protein